MSINRNVIGEKNIIRLVSDRRIVSWLKKDFLCLRRVSFAVGKRALRDLREREKKGKRKKNRKKGRKANKDKTVNIKIPALRNTRLDKRIFKDN